MGTRCAPRAFSRASWARSRGRARRRRGGDCEAVSRLNEQRQPHSVPISFVLGGWLLAAVTDKALGLIGGRHPRRLGCLVDRTKPTIRDEAVKGKSACAENDRSARRDEVGRLRACHRHSGGPWLRLSAGGDQGSNQGENSNPHLSVLPQWYA